jgi:hypothetical protein
MRSSRLGDGAVAQVVGTIALPISEVVLANRRGEHSRAVDLMRPILDRMYRLGGSHPQQDFLEQVFLDSAQGTRGDDVRLILARGTARYPTPPERRIGYAQAARQFRH